MPLPSIQPFPPDCPPEDAQPVSGVFYRLVGKHLGVGDSTDESSWLRPYQTQGSQYYKTFDAVGAHGLSVFADLADTRRARGIAPWMAKKSVAEVTVTEAEGSMRPSPTAVSTSHHDWWTHPVDLQPSGIVIEAGMES